MKYLESLKNKQIFQRVSLVEKMFMTRNLATILGAGLSLPRAFDILSSQTKNQKLKQITQHLKTNVKQGKSLARSLAMHPDVFDNLYISMVKIGETSGNLEQVLKTLDKQMMREHKLKSRLRNASIYPVIIIALMVCIGIAMMYFVVPKLILVFNRFDMQLPASTRLIIFTSHIMQKYGLAILAGLALLIIALKLFFKNKKHMRFIHWTLLNMPIWGQLNQQFNCAQFARTLSSLIKSGVPIVQSLKALEKIFKNMYYSESIQNIEKQVIKGKSLSKALNKYPKLYPVLIRQMVAVGEETGQLEDILDRLAKFYEDEVNKTTKNISTIIEPMLMIVIGIAVGFFALSILKPIYSILEGVS